MNHVINYDNLEKFAYSNDKRCVGPIKGIVITFIGLGALDTYQSDTADGIFYAERGIIYILPYINPWSWMNRQAVDYTDELLDVIISHYSLPESIPIAATGGSMGGQCALTYMVYAKRTPVICTANCPVCDLPYHFTERKDLPRTLYSAFFNELRADPRALEAASPLHLAERLPKARYRIFHCGEDEAVNKQKHSDRLIERIKGRLDVKYYEVPGRHHCDLTPEMWDIYRSETVNALLEAGKSGK